MDRIILHVDLDCFFAAIEVRDNPLHIGEPVVVGADHKRGKGRGIVATCSYEARKFGIHSGMPISKAYRLCPEAVFVRPNFDKYLEASQQFFHTIQKYSPVYQEAGIDEAYLDLSDICSDFDEARNIAELLQQEVYKTIRITCSVGCAPTKPFAKIASSYDKPNGITIIKPVEIKSFLGDMDITKIPGVGRKSKKYFNEHGIYKIRDLWNTSLPKMLELFGKYGKMIWQVAHGIDNRPVVEIYKRKSFGKQRTFYQDTADLNDILTTFEKLSEKIHEELREHKIFYKTVGITVRFEGFETFTRSKSVPYAIQDEQKAMELVFELLREFLGKKRKVRLVGIRFSNLLKDAISRQTTLSRFVDEK
ncbi:MAG: DNA polymerase IV, partial [Promethearchaeota archaeon]